MTEATEHHSTSHRWPASPVKPGSKPKPVPMPGVSLPPPPPPSSRRALLSGAALAAVGDVLASCIPTPTPAAEADAELIRLGAEFTRLQALLDPVMEEFWTISRDDPRLEALGAQDITLTAQQDELADQMRDIPALTPAGWGAKAAVARQLFLRHHEDEIEGGSMDEETAFAWSLINDLSAAGTLA